MNLYKYTFDKFIIYTDDELNKEHIDNLSKMIDDFEDYIYENIPNWCFLVILPDKFVYFNKDNILENCFDKDIISKFLFSIDPEILHEEATNYKFTAEEVIRMLDKYSR